MSVPNRAPRTLWIAVFVLTLIGVAAVTRRTIVLLFPGSLGGGSSSPAAALDTGVARHFTLTLIHILPGALYLALAAVQFMPHVRQSTCDSIAGVGGSWSCSDSLLACRR